MNKWISVKEKLPPPQKNDKDYSIDVLITDGLSITTGYHEYEYETDEENENYEFSSAVWWQNGDVLNTCYSGWPKVTHWMPLPSLPINDKKKEPN
jgi:hypothetical protein